MRNKILMLSAAAMAGAMAMAQAPAMQGRQAAGNYSLGSMRSHVLGHAPAAAKVMTVTCLGKAPMRAPGDGYVPKGEIELLFEDFSSEFFESGTIGKPDLESNPRNPNAEEEYDHPAWYNFMPGVCGGPNDIWGGNYVFPAGGCACLFNKTSYNITQSNIIIPLVDATAEGYEGIVHLQFIARTEDKSTKDGFLVLECAETYGISSTWTTLGQGQTPPVTKEWQTYDVAFYGGKGSVIMNIFNASGTSVYIDDIRVYQVGQPAQTPVVLPHSNYQGTSFTCNWKDAPGADSYLLNLWKEDKTYDSTSGQLTNIDHTFVLKDFPVEGTSYNVTGVEDGQKYFYNVRGVKGDYVSSYSFNIEVNQLLPATMLPVTDLAGDPILGTSGYTASWTPIGGAEVYNYTARFYREAAEDGPFMITDEDFTGVVDAKGFPTNLTKEDPDVNTYDVIYYDSMTQGGWRGLHSMPYKDYIAVDGFHYIFSKSDAGLVSPELDLSKNGGKFTISVDVAGEQYKGDDGTGKQVSGYPKVAIALFVFNEEKGEWEQVEMHQSGQVNFNWKTLEYQFENGGKRSQVGIYCTYSPTNLYIDNVMMWQEYKKGESLFDPFVFKRFHEGSSIYIEVPKHVRAQKMWHQVCGVKGEKIDDSPTGEIAFLESPWTEFELVGGSDQEAWAGVSQPTLSSASVQPAGDLEVFINNPACGEVVICDISGKQVVNCALVASQTVKLPAHGVYIVKVGDTSVKLHI